MASGPHAPAPRLAGTYSGWQLPLEQMMNRKITNKLRSHFEVSEWPLVVLTLLIAFLLNQLI